MTSKNAKSVALMQLVESVAPPAPPCFPSQAEWVGYIKWADAACDGEVQPLKLARAGKGRKANTFSDSFNFCADCDAKHKSSMLAQGRCRPQWIREQRWPAQEAA